MNKICTSIEQSQKLIELGIDVKTADMVWTYDFVVNDINGLNVISEQLRPEENDIPAWSLPALMNLFDDKAGLAKDYGLWFCYDNGKSHCSKHFDNSVDAAFEMIVWLKENNKL